MTKENLIICPNCYKPKASYKGTKYCQSCYRKMLDEYSMYDYLYKEPQDRKKYMSKNARYVCALLIENGVRDTKEIAKITKLNVVYIRQIIHKFTVKVNANGEMRPF